MDYNWKELVAYALVYGLGYRFIVKPLMDKLSGKKDE